MNAVYEISIVKAGFFGFRLIYITEFTLLELILKILLKKSAFSGNYKIIYWGNLIFNLISLLLVIIYYYFEWDCHK